MYPDLVDGVSCIFRYEARMDPSGLDGFFHCNLFGAHDPETLSEQPEPKIARSGQSAIGHHGCAALVVMPHSDRGEAVRLRIVM